MPRVMAIGSDDTAPSAPARRRARKPARRHFASRTAELEAHVDRLSPDAVAALLRLRAQDLRAMLAGRAEPGISQLRRLRQT